MEVPLLQLIQVSSFDPGTTDSFAPVSPAFLLNKIHHILNEISYVKGVSLSLPDRLIANITADWARIFGNPVMITVNNAWTLLNMCSDKPSSRRT